MGSTRTVISGSGNTIHPLPTEITYPSVSIPDATNTSIDNTLRSIINLRDNTTYNIRAVLRNNATGRTTIIDKVRDDTGEVFEFTTQLDENITIGIGTSLVLAHTSLSYHITQFNSNKETNYDLECFIYEWDDASSTYIKLGQSIPITNISNALFTPSTTTFPSATFTNLNYNKKHKSTCKIYNKTLGQYYNSGQELHLFDDRFTLNYLIDFYINTARTERTTNSITLYFTSLMDNRDPVLVPPGNSTHIFNTILFQAFYEISPLVLNSIDVNKTNVAFIDTVEGKDFIVTFNALQPNTNYSFKGQFSRNTLYSNILVDFGYSVTTLQYAVTYTLSDFTPTYDQFSFRLTGLTDNTGLANNFTKIQFYAYEIDGGVETLTSNSPFEYLDIPERTTRRFIVDGLLENTEYRVKVIFEKAGLYSISVDNLFTESTLVDPADIPLGATIILDDDNITTTTSSVQFKIIDFQSPDFADTELHTVELIVLTPAQIMSINESNIVHWDFSNSSLNDYYGNVLTPTQISDFVFSNGGIKNTRANTHLTFTPTDFSIFEGLGGDFRLSVSLLIPTDPIALKFKCMFVNPSNDRGFIVQIYDNTIFFQGYVRLVDGNPREMLFNIQYTITNHFLMEDFFDTRQDLEFTFRTIALGSDTSDPNLFGEAKLYTNGTERLSQYLTDMHAGIPIADWPTTTIENGVYLPTTSPNGYYDIHMNVNGVELYEFKMGTYSNPTSVTPPQVM